MENRRKTIILPISVTQISSNSSISSSLHKSNMSRVRENICNKGKGVLTQHNQRQPLGVFPNVWGKQAQFVAPDVGFAKTKSEGIVTRSQTARQEVFGGLSHSIACQESAFTIYKDFEGAPHKSKQESMEFVEEPEKITCWADIRPAHFCDNEMEADEVKDQEDAEAERDEMDEEEDEYEEEEDVSYIGERTGVDSEMANVRSRQRAGVNENYTKEHLVYSLSEYRRDIYCNMGDAELKFMLSNDYLRKQSDVTYNMRSILVDWMFEVANEYKLKRETLFLAMNYLDRFLTHTNIARSKLQLVGTAALFVASKCEEVYPPSLKEYVLVTDSTYTGKQLLQMEHMMLKTLGFHTAIPTSIFFCLDLLNQLCLSEACCTMSLYILETAIVLGEEFIKYYPSVLALPGVLLFVHFASRKPCLE